jgi:hypothetical protein
MHYIRPGGKRAPPALEWGTGVPGSTRRCTTSYRRLALGGVSKGPRRALGVHLCAWKPDALEASRTDPRSLRWLDAALFRSEHCSYEA